jgi:hypothetical protein
LCQLQHGIQDRAGHLPPDWGKRLLNQLAIGRVKDKFFAWRTSIWRGMRVLPQTQVLKNFFADRTLVDEANDPHFAGALGADKRICFVHLADKVRNNVYPALMQQTAITLHWLSWR